ncbi:GspH/FimT family pseudopilin [Phytohalomonas tamaricis]|uniref:GspH/FimT family pseudopilin n=1 Tax=Phytohalomonas tamaricis TaxID=2081032 RepID=UPI000D0B0119|nr:GspH/FimT family pseudopilin [Phytohalomonas tamaricis]
MHSGAGNGADIASKPFGSAASARAQCGFTLLEMIVVIVLIAIGLSLVSFGITRGLESVRTREAGRDLTLALRATRTQAITSGQATLLDFNLVHQSYRRPGQTPTSLPQGMHMQLTTAAALRVNQQAAVAFFPDGSSTGGSILLTKAGRTWRIDIAWLTGTVRWQEVPP